MAAIQIAAVDDVEEIHTFAVNCLVLAKDSKDGLPDFPSSFAHLLQHRNMCVVNIEAYNAVDNITKSFFRRRLDNVSYLEASHFFELVWGQHWNGGQPGQTLSLISVIEHAFEGQTMYKNPNTTLSNWLSHSWSPAMIRYALEDFAFLAEAIRTETKRTAFSFLRLDDFIHQFGAALADEIFEEQEEQEEEQLRVSPLRRRGRARGSHVANERTTSATAGRAQNAFQRRHGPLHHAMLGERSCGG